MAIDGNTQGLINRLGRLYVWRGDRQALESARELYSCAVDDEERFSLRFWWHEGVRDYASNQRAVERHMWELVEGIGDDASV